MIAAVVALFLFWVTARGKLQIYIDHATTTKPNEDAG